MSTPTITSFPAEVSGSSSDVTACEPDKVPVKKNYSCNGEWEYKDYPVINLPEMTGFGRYRRSVNAPKEWQMQHAQRSLHELKDSVVAHLGDCPPAGMDADVWRGFKAQHARSSSVVSTTSSTSIDEITGTKISRGFFPSGASSAESSFREFSSQCRRDSNLSKASVTSPSTDGESSVVSPQSKPIRFSPPKAIRPPGRRQYSRHTSTTSISPLAVINEVQEINAPPRRKIEKALKFDDHANNESAVASDDDDEFEWADMLELGGGASNLTNRLRQQPSSKAQADVTSTATRKCAFPSAKPSRSRAAGTRRATLHRSKTNKGSDRNGNPRVPISKRTLAHGEPTTRESCDQATFKFSKKEVEHVKLPGGARPKGLLPQQNDQGQESLSQHIVPSRQFARGQTQWMEKDNQNSSAKPPVGQTKGESMASATSTETLFARPTMPLVCT